MSATLTCYKIDSRFLPVAVGYKTLKSALCIGLDVAWLGGSASDPDSQYDFIAVALINTVAGIAKLDCVRVRLTNRDPKGVQTAAAITELVEQYGQNTEHIVLAIDAPIQRSEHDPVPPRTKRFRECERHLSTCRQKIDKAAGGSDGWHPNIQPGVPLASRVTKIVQHIQRTCNLSLWTPETAHECRLIVESFPAEAIWAAKRLGQYPINMSVSDAKRYKGQKGNQTSDAVRNLVKTTLLDSFKILSGIPTLWPQLVDDLLKWMLADAAWQREGLYRGGKLLDDVVDSGICLATAISYSMNNAHVWRNADHPADGHIMGPGRFFAL